MVDVEICAGSVRNLLRVSAARYQKGNLRCQKKEAGILGISKLMEKIKGKVADVAEDIKEFQAGKGKELKEDLTEGLGKAKEFLKDKVEDANEEIKEFQASKGKELKEDFIEGFGKAKEAIKSKFDEVSGDVKESLSKAKEKEPEGDAK